MINSKYLHINKLIKIHYNNEGEYECIKHECLMSSVIHQSQAVVDVIENIIIIFIIVKISIFVTLFTF